MGSLKLFIITEFFIKFWPTEIFFWLGLIVQLISTSFALILDALLRVV